MKHDMARLYIMMRQILLVCLSGALVMVSFPPFGCWPCILVAWLPLLAAIAKTSLKRGFYLGFLQGMVAYGASLYWLINIFKYAALPLVAILALFTGLFGVLACFVDCRVHNEATKALLLAGVWTSIEFFRAEIFFLKFAWITPGLAVGPVWITPVAGVYGVSFLVFVTTTFLYHRSSRPVGLILALITLGLGYFRPGRVEPVHETLKVAAVQSEECRLATYIEMTRGINDPDVELIVWPEYAVPYDIYGRDPDSFAMITGLADKLDSIIVFGTKTGVNKNSDGWRNTAMVVDGDGIIGEYYKNHPVHFFNDGIPGRGGKVIKALPGTFGTPVCFDFDYTSLMRRMTLQGAEFFAVPSFDAEHWSAAQHFQHSAMIPVRAVENGRWVVCAASSGVSQIIDPYGNVHHSIAPMIEGVIVGMIERLGHQTFYTRIGWIFPWLCMVITVSGLIAVAITSKPLRHFVYENQ